MNRPLGDQRGEYLPTDPGTVYLMAGEVQDADSDALCIRDPARIKNNLAPIGRPVRINLPLLVFRENQPGRATLGRDDVAFHLARLIRGAEQDLGAVR